MLEIKLCLGSVIGDDFSYLRIDGNIMSMTHEIEEASLFPMNDVSDTMEGYRLLMATLAKQPLAWLPVCVTKV